MGWPAVVKGREDRIVNTIVYLGLALVAVVSIFPLLFVVSASITPYSEILRNGGYVIIPQGFTIDAYAQLLADPAIPRSLGVTVFITVVGTLINMILTTLLAYPLSRPELPGRGFLTFAVLFTMLFSAGLIPTYLVVKDTGLLDTVWAMIIPGAVAVFNVLIMKAFFERLPQDLLEAARIDGAGEFRTLWRIVIPLSLPVIMTIGLFYAVGHWNEFMNAILYIRDQTLYPMQVVVRRMLDQSQSFENVDAVVPTVTLQMAAIVIAAAPMIAVYPFIQKYFQDGVMLGSVKG
jgi:putative aldouronate transport system permease protein